MKNALLLFAIAAVLTGCTSPIVMRNPTTGQTASCGPYPSGGIASLSTPAREAQCIQDFKEQGFVRVAD